MRMKNFTKNFCILLLLAGCNSRHQDEGRPVRLMKYSEVESTPAAAVKIVQSPTSSIPSPSRGRMVIQTSTLSFEVANYDEALVQIQKIASQYGGYLVSSSTQVHNNNVKSGSVTLRIEAKNFDAALQALKQLAKKLDNESLQGNDVTEEFYDLTARLDNKRKAEKRYQEILAIAKSAKDILEVEQALTNVREEIERMEGRKRFLEDQVALSTITVNLHEPYPLMASGQYGFLAKMRRGVEEGISGFSDVLSACITFVIAGIPIFVMLFLIIWIFRRYRRRAKAAQLAKATMAEKKE
jgi:hypothetical protein